MIRLLNRQRAHVLAAVVLAIWCVPYLTTGTRVDRADFAMFCQAYEAIRQSVLHYHQFPWMNPWVSGGVPLYADPQIGVFSIQTVLVLLFGAPVGLKVATVVYICLGYASMTLLLRRYFKVDATLTAFLSLLWVMCSFFVARLPVEFTFVWDLLAPLFVYLSLTAHDWRSGLKLGAAFAVMALSSVHNSFFQIGIICVVILAVRVFAAGNRAALLRACAGALVVFVVIAGHRLLLTAQNVSSFTHHSADSAPNVGTSLLAFVVPYTGHQSWWSYNPATPYGWGEVTATLGVGFDLVFVIAIALFVRRYRSGDRSIQGFRRPAVLLIIGAVFVLIGVGDVGSVSLYDGIKHIPIFSDMRVPSRWFIFTSLVAVAFVGVMLAGETTKARLKRVATVLLAIGIVEGLVLNAGASASVIKFSTVNPPRAAYTYPFVQTWLFGESTGDNRIGRDIGPLTVYREYEATRFNIGVLRANNALLLLDRSTPLCTVAQGCSFVVSNNADLISWSPNKFVLRRTAPGAIVLDVNDSNYYSVNGARRTTHKTANAVSPLTIIGYDIGQVITVKASGR